MWATIPIPESDPGRRLVNRREPSLIYTAIPLVHGTITDAHLATVIGPLLPLIDLADCLWHTVAVGRREPIQE